MRRKAWHGIAVLTGAIALPAMAAHAEWRLPEVAPEASAIVASNQVEPLPFERAGATFPGSALYFLADPPAAASTVNVPVESSTGVNPIAAWNGDPDAAIAIETAGPAARSFVSRGTGIDKARALDCLAKAVYYEAASESEGGQRAVHRHIGQAPRRREPFAQAHDAAEGVDGGEVFAGRRGDQQTAIIRAEIGGRIGLPARAARTRLRPRVGTHLRRQRRRLSRTLTAWTFRARAHGA